MTPGLLALGVAALVSFLLILRDPAIHRGPERFIIASSWPAMIALFGFLQRTDVDRLGFAVVVGAICIATLGGPALIMDREQREAAEAGIARANEANDGKVVTTIEPMGDWYPAEDYHQDYWAGEGQRNPYCLAVIPPKLQKLRKSFQARVRDEAQQGA